MSNETKKFPKHLDKFNWGAFFLTWIWGIGNSTWVALWVLLLWLIPIVGIILVFVFAIILGLKGNELAWKNKKWENEEHFTRVQKLWAGWGLGIFILGIITSIFALFILGGLLAFMSPAIMGGINEVKLKNSRIIIMNTIRASQNDPNGINISSSSAAVDSFVKYGQNLVKVSNNSLKDKNGVYYTFDCKNNSCDITVDVNGEKAPNKMSTREEIQDRVNLRINKNYNIRRIELFAPDWLYEEVGANPAPKNKPVMEHKPMPRPDVRPNPSVKPNPADNHIQHEPPQNIDNGDHHKHKPHQPHQKGEKHHKEKHSEQ